MKELRFDTGLVSYKINDAVEVTFNPTDSAFIERLYTTFEALDKKQDTIKNAIESAVDSGEPKQIFEITRKIDAEMRTMIDDVLGTPVCGALFGGMNVYALADGMPVWCNLLMAIIAEVPESVDRELKSSNPRIEKYTAKYRK